MRGWSRSASTVFGCAGCRHIGFRRVEAERILGEFRGDQAALFGPLQGDGDVGLALRERKGARHRHELDAQFRMAGDQTAEARREEGDAEAIGGADTHGAGDGAVEMPDALLGAQHLGFHPLGRVQEDFAFGREIAAVGAANEQPRLQPLFQRGDAAAERGVIDAEPLRGPENLAGARNGKEHANVVPIHERPRTIIFAQRLLKSVH